MNTATQNGIGRRAFLAGAGVMLALPALGRAAEAPPPRRLVAIQTNQGIMPHLFFPERAGREFELSPYLKVLEAFRNDFTVFSNVCHPGVDGGHANEVSFLTGAPHPAGAGFRNSVSVDQLAAEQLGNQTRFSSLVVGVSNGGDPSMSFNRSGVLIPPEKNAASLYRKLFVQGTAKEIEARVSDLRSGRSLLDTVQARARRLEKSAAAGDRQRLDQYFSSIRELEQQLLQAEAWEQKPKPKVAQPEPPEIKESSQLVTKLKHTLDVIKLALETDSTRIVSLFIQPLGVLSEIPQVSRETHSLTHHGNRPEMIEELQKIETAQFAALRDFLTNLRGVQEAGSTLLDRSAILYGTCMGNANGHTNKDWPMMLIGGGFKHGQHLAFSKDKNENLGKLFVSLLQRVGVETDRFAAASGTMPGLEMA
ncbi:DUF1552 domain-containing protein [Anatilimnocola floriformis]|uniref:DUF1552 domain-containing protein n=1 Tax=Anatilimnocola floriformis TaxID=2948575 RepID=UPI0020C1DB01|nr:DUF1552 domain-containing protein [Anatilimnocola floriformis]